MRMKFRFVAGAIAFLGATSASATTIDFQEVGGYLGTTTVEIAAAEPDTNRTGAGFERLSVDLFNRATSPYGETQALILFDDIFGAGAIPTAGVDIQSASLRFWTKSFSDGPVTIHQMLTDWNIGTTWNSLGGDGIAGDIVATPDDTKTNITDEALVTFDVTNSLTAWAASGGVDNYGWGLQNASRDGWDFNTESYSGGSSPEVRRPLLSVTYTKYTVPEPTTILLLGLGLAGLGFARKRLH